MKIILNNSNPLSNWMAEKAGSASDWAAGKVANGFMNGMSHLIHSTAPHLPDLGGYITIAAGLALMFPLFKKSKVIGIWLSCMTGILFWIAAV